MAASRAVIQTPNASQYLQQLCKHWSHKFAVEFAPEQGSIPFAPDRSCKLDASGDILTTRIEAANEPALERMQGVVLDHLKRFAFRKNLDTVTWQRASQ